MVAYPPNGSISSTTQTTKIANYSLKASTGKSIHVGENSITSKRVGKRESTERERERKGEREKKSDVKITVVFLEQVIALFVL